MNLNFILILSAMLASLTGAVSGDRAIAATGGAPEAVQGVAVAANLATRVRAVVASTVLGLVNSQSVSGYGPTKAIVALPHVDAPHPGIIALYAQRRE